MPKQMKQTDWFDSDASSVELCCTDPSLPVYSKVKDGKTHAQKFGRGLQTKIHGRNDAGSIFKSHGWQGSRTCP